MSWISVLIRVKFVNDHRVGRYIRRLGDIPGKLVYMKSYCKGTVIDLTLLHAAINEWRKGQSGRQNYWRIIKEYGTEEDLVRELECEIQTRSLTFRPIEYQERCESLNHKLRIIGQQSVKQQIVDYAVIIAMQDFLDAKIGFYQVASIKGKGALFAGKTIRKWCRPGRGYWVHMDIRKCYPSISADVVMDILKKYVKSDDVLYASECLLKTYGKGLSIGSYFSLKMAQLVLSFGYHFIEQLHTRRRAVNRPLVEHQLWYADDIYLFSRDKRNLIKATNCLAGFMKYYYGLRFHRCKICRVGSEEPVIITTFKCFPEKRILKPDLFLRIRRAYANFEENPNIYNARKVCSYWGSIKHSDMYGTAKNNGYDRIFEKAKKYVSNYERGRRHDRRDTIDGTDRTSRQGLQKRSDEALAAERHRDDY